MHTTKKEDPMTWKQWKNSHLSTGKEVAEMSQTAQEWKDEEQVRYEPREKC